MQVRIGSAVAALVACGVAAGVAGADIIEFRFHGVVDSVSGSSVLLQRQGLYWARCGWGYSAAVVADMDESRLASDDGRS